MANRKWYGSISNRIDEGKNYNEDKLIHEGDDITMYYWSDRRCYYVTKVVNQKRIFVKKYEVVADREKEGGMGHQNWLYFRTVKECNDYLKKYGLGYDEVYENSEEEWVYRYNNWYQAFRYNLNTWNKCLENAKKDCKNPDDEEAVKNLARFYMRLSPEELEKVLSGKEVVKYYKLQKVSFGVKEYYYDWEF